MVVEEAGEEAGGERPHLLRARPTTRRTAWGTISRSHEPLGVAALGRGTRAATALARASSSSAPRLAVEAHQVGDHPQEARARRRGAGLANRPRGVPAYSKPRAVAHGEAHVGGLGGHPELVQQRLEVRVVAVVEDDEAGVHPVGLVGQVDPHGVGVAAHVVVGLVDGDVVLGMQLVRGTRAPRCRRRRSRSSSLHRQRQQRAPGERGAARRAPPCPSARWRGSEPAGAARVAATSPRSQQHRRRQPAARACPRRRAKPARRPRARCRGRPGRAVTIFTGSRLRVRSDPARGDLLRDAPGARRRRPGGRARRRR